MGERIRRVVIIGGGTAGWMTAAALAKSLERTGTAITLVESDAIGTIGVGEATIPTIHWFNHILGLDEAAFLRETKGTYKLGIEFVGWNGPGSRYLHPFGLFGGPGDGVMFLHRLIRARLAGQDHSIEDYSLTAQLAYAGRFAQPSPDRRSIQSTLGYAYHFDASLYAAFLRRNAEAKGVIRHEGKIVRIDQHPESGFVTAVTTERDTRVEGDFFIDCSGLRALLIEGVLKAGFEDWSAWLPCDRAWAVPCAAAEPFRPMTRAFALEAGWRWRIPLQHRIGNGYVFSSRFIDEDAARRTLLEQLESPATAEPRLIRFAAGRRRRAWVKNVVAIGLSSGFLEPLESTSIHLIQSGIAKLLALFPDRDCNPLLADQFDRVFGEEMNGIRDFLFLHYHNTAGRNGPMWRHCQELPMPDSLAAKLAQFEASGRIVLTSDELFRDASWFAVMTGQGVIAHDYNPLIDGTSAEDNQRHLEAVRMLIRKTCESAPELR
jgi:tryptophan halogenase